MRGGPGIGTIQPGKSDYYMNTRGGGNGDYRTITLAPASIQEAVDLMGLAFDLADKYRNPVVVAADGMIGQMMEPVEFGMYEKMDLPEKIWALNGDIEGRKPNKLQSLRSEGRRVGKEC